MHGVAQGREKTLTTKQKLKRLTLHLPEGLHRAIKRRAVEEGVRSRFKTLIGVSRAS
jgi:hypothetical protein